MSKCATCGKVSFVLCCSCSPMRWWDVVDGDEEEGHGTDAGRRQTVYMAEELKADGKVWHKVRRRSPSRWWWGVSRARILTRKRGYCTGWCVVGSPERLAGREGNGTDAHDGAFLQAASAARAATCHSPSASLVLSIHSLEGAKGTRKLTTAAKRGKETSSKNDPEKRTLCVACYQKLFGPKGAFPSALESFSRTDACDRRGLRRRDGSVSVARSVRRGARPLESSSS